MAQSNLVGVFKIDAYRDSTRQTAYADINTRILNVLLEEECGRLPFYTGVGCDNDFFYTVAGKASNKFGNMELLWANSIDWAHCATKHMVSSFELSGALEGNDIKWLFNDRDELLIS